MIFRFAKMSDIPEMQELYVDTVRIVCRKDYDQKQIEVWISGINNSERWIDVIENQFVLLAIIENTIVGYGTLKNSNYIDFFYVHKDFQRQGIAGKILLELENEAKNAKSKIISSDVSITAKPFFEKKGYVVKAEQRNVRQNIELVNFKMIKELEKI